MDALLAKLPEFGVLGVLCAVLLYLVVKLQNQFIGIVQNNTNAFHQLKLVIEKCQITHTPTHTHHE